MPLADKLKEYKPKVKRTTPLWAGPNGSGELGGVTQSMLGRFLVCRERFRIHYVEGLQPTRKWESRTGFGDMWHVCEEMLAGDPHSRSWELGLQSYLEELLKKYPLQQEDIIKWYAICKTQFPVYVDYWAKNPDVVARTPLMQEQKFDVKYTLPSGRCVRLRGKFDSVDLIDKHERFPKGIWLQENKTKGRVNEIQLKRQLSFDLQTMFYLIALHNEGWAGYESEGHFASDVPPHPILGVRYNVIRRDCPVVQHKDRQLKAGFKKGETQEEWCERLRRDYFAADPQEWFFRWKSEVTVEDVDKFRLECLDPVLENLLDDYEWWSWVAGDGKTWKEQPASVWESKLRHTLFEHHQNRHYRHPFGIYNVLNEGGTDDVDQYLADGSEVGLRRAETMFEELQG